MAYATAADLVNFYDTRTIEDLASDTGTPVDPGDLDTDPKVLAALSVGSGEVESAAVAGGIYTRDTLAALTGDSLALLKSLVCDVAICRLLMRRVQKYAEAAEICKRVADKLELLRTGHNVFGTDATEAAGLISVDGPTTFDYQRLNLIVDRTRHFYPNRQQRLPLGR